MAEFSSQGPMKPFQGSASENPVTEMEAARAILVQGIPLLDQELTETSIIQVFSPFGDISKLLLQTHEKSSSQKAVIVFSDVQAAKSALQADGRDILGNSCKVSLASSMPMLSDGSLASDNINDQADGASGKGTAEQPAGRTLTTAEWIKNIFAQGIIYTRMFDEKLGVSDKAKAIAAKVSTTAKNIDDTHDVTGKFAAVTLAAHTKAKEVDTKLGVSEAASRWAQKTKESTNKALENNPRVASGVQQAGAKINKIVKDVGDWGTGVVASTTAQAADGERMEPPSAESDPRADGASATKPTYPAVEKPSAPDDPSNAKKL